MEKIEYGTDWYNTLEAEHRHSYGPEWEAACKKAGDEAAALLVKLEAEEAKAKAKAERARTLLREANTAISAARNTGVEADRNKWTQIAELSTALLSRLYLSGS